ncbi:Scr1 family TA system antitoxin-like transcriptional regulator [Lentzea sp. NPDC102401]|uniref:Scr1 family TA system antitoxin-like transcriptional regulator n=1 Tax=Lentzea sp. NPDC102401 TaxID=3364128 RepID=UPI0038304997
MSLAEACTEAGFSAANLSMMENALRPFDPLNVMILGRVYGLPNEVWKRQVRRAEFAAEERRKVRYRQSAYDLDEAKDVDKSRLEAAAICAFGADAIPRLLQTADYRASITPPDALESAEQDSNRWPESQTDWLKYLAANEASNPAVDVVLTKRAIHQVVGSPAITNAALMQLVHLSDFDHFTVQVLDDEPRAEIRPESSYCHLTFPHEQHNDVVYLESAGCGRYIEDPTTCQLIRQGFKALQRCALSSTQSIEAIAEAASSLRASSSRRPASRKPRAKRPGSIVRKGKGNNGTDSSNASEL